ncbi:MAG: NfeD family protein [Actinobacteria bacterium]|nr:NfeD family protein [Actinomycetota bacterium]
MSLLIAILLAVFVLPPRWGLVAVAAAGLLETGETYLWFRWSRRRRAAVGVEALIGRAGVATTALWPEGQVRVDGELWQARCAGGADAGARVVVTGIEGLTLTVEPEQPS